MCRAWHTRVIGLVCSLVPCLACLIYKAYFEGRSAAFVAGSSFRGAASRPALVLLALRVRAFELASLVSCSVVSTVFWAVVVVVYHLAVVRSVVREVPVCKLRRPLDSRKASAVFRETFGED